MAQQVNHRMVTLARESREMTQRALAVAAGITQGALSKIENGILPCGEDVVEKIANALDYPRRFFYFDRSVHGLGTGAHHLLFRKRVIPQRTLKRIEAELNIKRMNLEDLVRSVDIRADKDIPRYSLDDFGGDVEQVAQSVRIYWDMPSGPVDNVTYLIERAGGIVIEHDFGSDKVDATSLRVKGLPPMIFISPNLPGDRQRFTLAHELGHLVMHDVPHPSVEDEANKFAAAFLMPAGEVGHYLHRMNLARAAKLKPHWKTSMAALIFRAHDLGRIDSNAYRYLMYQMSASGLRVAEPPELAVPREKSATHSALLKYFMDSLGYSSSEMMDMFGVNERDYERMYGVREESRPRHLSVVR